MDNLRMNYYQWEKEKCTIMYSRTLIKGRFTTTWMHETATFSTPKEASQAVNEWNRISKLMFDNNPEGGMWIYIQE